MNRFCFLPVTAAVLLCGAALVSPLGAAEAPKLKLDSKPLDRSARGASYAPVIKQVTPSVVSLTVTPKEQTWTHPFLDDPAMRRFFGDQLRNLRRLPAPRELGSGVIVTEDGYILTNNHVVEDGEKIQVTLADGKTTYPAKLIGADPQTDVAVVKIEGKNLPVVRLADSSLLEVGDVVIAIGNPFNVGQTVTSGIISGTGRGDLPFGRVTDYEDFIQTDAAINPGNSGGPLVDAEGRLIGINTFIMSNGGGNQGLGFAIPINLARNVMERLVTDGRVRRGYLGVGLQPLDPELAKQFKAPSTAGALVSSVQPDTPAARAGLREGDIITSLNGKPVADNRTFRLSVSQLSPGTKVSLKLLRGGQEKSFAIVLDELPVAVAAAPRAEREETPAATTLLDDVELVSLERGARGRLEIPNSVKGALVRKVAPGSLPEEAGLKAGDVVVEVNRQPVATPQEVVSAAREAKGDRLLLLRVYSSDNDGGTRYLVLEKPAGKN